MNWKTHFFREDEKPFLSAESGILISPTFAETDMILTRATTTALPPIVTKRYSRGESNERIAEQMRSLFPAADKKTILKLMGSTRKLYSGVEIPCDGCDQRTSLLQGLQSQS